MTPLDALLYGAVYAAGMVTGYHIGKKVLDRYHMNRFRAGWNAAVTSQLMAREPRYLGVDDDEGAYDGTRTMA